MFTSLKLSAFANATGVSYSRTIGYVIVGTQSLSVRSELGHFDLVAKSTTRHSCFALTAYFF